MTDQRLILRKLASLREHVNRIFAPTNNGDCQLPTLKPLRCLGPMA